jgi:hypothetical protein
MLVDLTAASTVSLAALAAPTTSEGVAFGAAFAATDTLSASEAPVAPAEDAGVGVAWVVGGVTTFAGDPRGASGCTGTEGTEPRVSVIY